ncbi:hypothetical protein O181_113025 [Austropuccinia psidii MF-1]|uniref:Uncharacterized protein n=1 Tax=Austropuccinia psidii MF-1 TaxID=1389203 RepID=A0A9Q3K5L0_9BASI|nr:hypothetical protein [Austropuccinia psidii MF-1]
MTPTRSGSNYSIQANGSGPGHSSHKPKIQECQPRGDAHREDYRTSTSSQRPESLPTGSSRDIPVPVQKLVYGSKTAQVGTSPMSFERNHELISSSEGLNGARKDRGTYVGLETHVLQRTSPTDKSLAKKPKHVIRQSEEEVAQGKDTSKNPAQQVPNKPKQTPKTNQKGKK